MMKVLRFIITGWFVATMSLATTARAEQVTFKLAVVPQFAATQVNHDWTPLLAALEQATGYHLQLTLYEQVQQFESELLQGVPDFVYLNPYHMVMANEAQGYRPLLRDSDNLSGILVVRRDGPIKSLADLANATVAFPSPNALGASLYLRALLAETEKITVKPDYVGNHQTVYRQVLRGDAAAGGGVLRTLNKEPDAVREQLSILYSTPDVASHPFAAHPRVANEVVQKITDALLALGNDATGRKLLEAVLMPKPVRADYQRDYAQLGKLKLERYAVNPPR